MSYNLSPVTAFETSVRGRLCDGVPPWLETRGGVFGEWWGLDWGSLSHPPLFTFGLL